MVTDTGGCKLLIPLSATEHAPKQDSPVLSSQMIVQNAS